MMTGHIRNKSVNTRMISFHATRMHGDHVLTRCICPSLRRLQNEIVLPQRRNTVVWRVIIRLWKRSVHLFLSRKSVRRWEEWLCFVCSFPGMNFFIMAPIIHECFLWERKNLLKNFNILKNRAHYNYFMLKNPGFHLFTKNVHLKRLKSFCIELIAIRKAFFKDKKLDWNVIERISHVLFNSYIKTHNKSWMILASNTWSLYFFFVKHSSLTERI